MSDSSDMAESGDLGQRYGSDEVHVANSNEFELQNEVCIPSTAGNSNAADDVAVPFDIVTVDPETFETETPDSEDEDAGATSAAPSIQQLYRTVLERDVAEAVDNGEDVDDVIERDIRDELLMLMRAGVLDGEDVERMMDHILNRTLPRKPDDRRIPEECLVCLEQVRLDRRRCCDAPICTDCLKTYVETQLEEAGVVRIGCPNPSCDRHIYSEEVRELLRFKPQLRDRYDRWVVDMNADPHRKTCPRCCRITDVEPQQMSGRQTTKYGLLVECPDCQLRWCFSCQAPWHEGLTCSKNRAGDALLKKWALQKTVSERNAQQCPKCKVYIQRISGCDHMQCNRCDTKFCYRCGERRFKLKLFGYRLEDHDKKYSIIGCNDRYEDHQRIRRVVTRGGLFGAKVVGSLVAVPVLCAAAGVAAAALTVAAPVYGVYRLARHIRKPSDDVSDYHFDYDDYFSGLSDLSTYSDDSFEEIAPVWPRPATGTPLPRRERRFNISDHIHSQVGLPFSVHVQQVAPHDDLSEGSGLEDGSSSTPPPLPPRLRRKSTLLEEDSGPPPLPPKLRTVPSTRRQAPDVPPPHLDGAVLPSPSPESANTSVPESYDVLDISSF